jgi:Zn-dependent peptidase ImmA (M78 family)
MRSTPVPITPAVLAWAIKESGLNEDAVAAHLGVPAAQLSDWLEGQSQPTLTQFRKLASLLKRTPATFLLPKPPESAGRSVQFRRPAGTARNRLNPTELRYIREATRIQRVLSWVLLQLGEKTKPLPKVDVGSDLEEISKRERERLGATNEMNWKSSSDALRDWRSKLEAAGILVFFLPIGKESCRGFSLWDERCPLVAANTSWNSEARIFTLFHEYAHLLSRTDSACLEDGSGHQRLASSLDQAERWCERFAAALLLPWDVLAKELASAGKRVGRIEDLKTASILASHFKVSLRAVVLRLIQRGLATWELYRQIPVASDEKRGGGGGEGRPRRQIREDQYGRRATDLFLSAVEHEILSPSDVLSFLDVADADLDRMRQSGVGD